MYHPQYAAYFGIKDHSAAVHPSKCQALSIIKMFFEEEQCGMCPVSSPHPVLGFSFSLHEQMTISN